MRAKFKKLLSLTTLLLVFAIIFINSSIVYGNTEKLYLGGYTCGFSISTNGTTVIGLTEVVGENGVVSPSKCSGIKVGDTILSVNGKKISNSNSLQEVLSEYKEGYLIVEVLRNDKRLFFDVFPEKDIMGYYKIGVFLRDDLTGIGTITYVKEDGGFASLGHPILDSKGNKYSILGGNVYNSSIVGVERASKGKAGELKGIFIGDKPKGEVFSNLDSGMYGKFYNFEKEEHTEIESSTAKIGKAKIYSTVDGETPKYYDIEIVKTDFRKGNLKNLVIKIIDKDLLEYTGGILQGMSGSPIVQEDKLVGAVTHVFINDSTRGFGISIDNMLN